jgi:NADH:ubiquinone oxidoreductase subunit C
MSSSQPKMTFRPVPVPPAPILTGTGLPKSPEQIADALKQKYPGSVLNVETAHKGDPFLIVKADQLLDILGMLRDDERFSCTLLQCISATDFLEIKAGPPEADGTPSAIKAQDGRIEVLYALWSYTHRHQILIKVKLDRNHPKVKTACDLWRAANWYERECWDLLGVIFEGHPDHQRILLPPDWVGHPLRKDYVFPDDYNGMKVPL